MKLRRLQWSEAIKDFDIAVRVKPDLGETYVNRGAAKIGPGCILFQNVTLGMGNHPDTRQHGAPTLEARVHVAPGATLLGPIRIGAGSKIMPGCVVIRDVPAGSVVEAPVPAVRARPGKVDAAVGAPVGVESSERAESKRN